MFNKDGLNDFDIWQRCINEMNLNEAAVPFVNGKALIEESQVEIYNKIQALLNSTGMEASHPFLYSLDPSDLTESECIKVNNLYKLGQDRGLIPQDDQDEISPAEPEDISPEQPAAVQPSAPALAVLPSAVPLQRDAFTVCFSAMKDGMVKTGQTYSNAFDIRSAKSDALAKLDKAGYTNISILAIEAGDPDSRGAVADISTSTDEADRTDPMAHSLDAVGVNASSATMKANDVAALQMVTDADDDKDSDEKEPEDDSKKEDDAKDEGSEDKDSKEDKEQQKEDAKEPDEKLKDDGSSSDNDDDNSSDGEDDNSGEEDKEDSKEDEKKDVKKLTPEQAAVFKDKYKKAFKAALLKCKFKVPFSELSLEQKVKFFTELNKAWGSQPDPAEFMTDKETQQLEKIVVNQGK